MNEFIKTQNQKISEYDADLSKFLEAESDRQEEHIELIASGITLQKECWKHKAVF